MNNYYQRQIYLFAEQAKIERILYSKFQQFNTAQSKVLREICLIKNLRTVRLNTELDLFSHFSSVFQNRYIFLQKYFDISYLCK